MSVLDQVVASHGAAALDDPVALRLALRHNAPDLPGAEVDLLVAVAGAGAADMLRRARRAGGSAADAVPTAARAVAERAGLPESEVEPACRAFAATLDGTTAGPPTQTGARPVADTATARPPADAAAVDWGTPGGQAPAPTRPLPRRPGRSWVVAAAVFVLVVAVVATVLALRPDPTPPPDRFAVDQVAQRYRALGSTLLDGALRCAPLPTEPGERERVDCSFGTWSTVLTEYDSPGRLAEVRTAALADDPAAARQATAPGDPAFAMSETTAKATVYWDASAPRPVSALVGTNALSLPELATFFDGRGAPVRRPEVPGAAFRSAALWTLARPFVGRTAATCAAQSPGEAIGGSVESVKCRYPEGVTAEFVLRPSADDVLTFRANYAGPDGARPGTTRLGGWADGPVRGQLVEYVGADDGVSYLYFDQPDLQAFGLMYASRPQDDLKAFWTATTG